MRQSSGALERRDFFTEPPGLAKRAGYCELAAHRHRRDDRQRVRQQRDFQLRRAVRRRAGRGVQGNACAGEILIFYGHVPAVEHHERLRAAEIFGIGLDRNRARFAGKRGQVA